MRACGVSFQQSLMCSLQQDASRDPFEFLQGPGIGTFRMPGMPPFRGRARIGRGGRLIFDRRPVKPLDDNGGVICWESDNDYNPR